MSCDKKTKYTCGNVTPSTCIEFEGDPNTQSTLRSGCIDQEQVDQDQYNQLGKIWTEIDLSALGDRCLQYVKTTEGKIIVKNAFLKMEEEICNLKTQVTNLQNNMICDTNISNCGIDFGCLQTACGDQIQTLKDFIQAITDRVCD